MNVLIYSGPETLPQSLDHTTTTLRALLLPHYSVQLISLNTLNTQPWTISCALLVLPRCIARLTPKASDLIQKFVETGGSVLAFSVGASIPALRDKAQESLLLAFYDETTRNRIHLTLIDGDQPSRTTVIRVPDGDLIDNISDSSLSLIGFDASQENVRVLGSYPDGTLAGVQCTIGRGKIILWAPSLESPLTQGPSSAILSTSLPITPSSEDRRRLDLIRTTLPLLLPASPPPEHTPASHPLPQFLSSAPSSPTLISKFANAIAAPSPGSQLSTFKDDNDTFHFHTLAESGALLKTSRELDAPAASTSDLAQWQPKHVVLCTDGALPTRDQTPLFDHSLYYDYLSQERKAQHLPETAGVWALGEALLYGEVVTSTQTMLDKSVFYFYLFFITSDR